MGNGEDNLQNNGVDGNRTVVRGGGRNGEIIGKGFTNRITFDLQILDDLTKAESGKVKTCVKYLEVAL